MGPIGYHSYLGFLEWWHRDGFQRDRSQCSGHSFGEDVKCTVGTMRVSFVFSSPKADVCLCVFAIVFGRVFQHSRPSDTRSYRLLKMVGHTKSLMIQFYAPFFPVTLLLLMRFLNIALIAFFPHFTFYDSHCTFPFFLLAHV